MENQPKKKKKARLPLAFVPGPIPPSGGVAREFLHASPSASAERKRVQSREQGKKRGELAWEQNRENAAVAAGFFLSLFFFFSSFDSLFFSSGQAHLGLVVDRQHDLIDAGVLEGLFGEVIERRSGDKRREKGERNLVFIFFFCFFLFFFSSSGKPTRSTSPLSAPIAPSAVHLLLPTLVRWRQEDVLFALAQRESREILGKGPKPTAGSLERSNRERERDEQRQSRRQSSWRVVRTFLPRLLSASHTTPLFPSVPSSPGSGG